MRLLTSLLLVAGLALLSADTASSSKQTVAVRGKSQDVYYEPSAISPGRAPKILFAPGDGGWHGLAVKMADAMSSWGYDVYGLDTKRYLESFTPGGKATLTEKDIAADMNTVASWIRGKSPQPVVFVGWSTGAALGTLAAADPQGKQVLRGFVAIGLPRNAVLGWRFADTLSILARREPDEPHFPTAPAVAAVSPLPLYLIYGDADQYTAPDDARRLFSEAREPKQISLIDGGNHSFDFCRDDFFQHLREALGWVGRQPGTPA